MAVESITMTVKQDGKNAPEFSLESDIGGELTLQELQLFNIRATQKIFVEVLKEEQIKGFTDEPVIRVDSKSNKSILDLKPFGRIEAFSKAVPKEVLLQLYKEIEKRSKFYSGTYKKHNWVYYNTQVVARSAAELALFLNQFEKFGNFDEGDVIRFINVVPYARKLETRGDFQRAGGKPAKARTGKSRKTGNVITKPNGAYFNAYRSIRNNRRFGAIKGSIRFTYTQGGTFNVEQPPIRHPDTGKLMRNTYSSRNKRGAGRKYLYPTIAIVIGSNFAASSLVPKDNVDYE